MHLAEAKILVAVKDTRLSFLSFFAEDELKLCPVIFEFLNSNLPIVAESTIFDIIS